LPEAVIALALWMLLAVGASQLLTYAVGQSAAYAERQELTEQARIAADALSVNIQLADEVNITLAPDNTLRTMTLYQYDTSGARAPYTFTYNNTSPWLASYRRLELGGNEMAARLSQLRLYPSADGEYVEITVTAEGGGATVTLSSVVDTRYKILRFS
jgi:type II secretory pathway component PulJ